MEEEQQNKASNENPGGNGGDGNSKMAIPGTSSNSGGNMRFSSLTPAEQKEKTNNIVSVIAEMSGDDTVAALTAVASSLRAEEKVDLVRRIQEESGSSFRRVKKEYSDQEIDELRKVDDIKEEDDTIEKEEEDEEKFPLAKRRRLDHEGSSLEQFLDRKSLTDLLNRNPTVLDRMKSSENSDWRNLGNIWSRNDDKDDVSMTADATDENEDTEKEPEGAATAAETPEKSSELTKYRMWRSNWEHNESSQLVEYRLGTEEAAGFRCEGNIPWNGLYAVSDDGQVWNTRSGSPYRMELELESESSVTLVWKHYAVSLSHEWENVESCKLLEIVDLEGDNNSVRSISVPWEKPQNRSNYNKSSIVKILDDGSKAKVVIWHIWLPSAVYVVSLPEGILETKLQLPFKLEHYKNRAKTISSTYFAPSAIFDFNMGCYYLTYYLTVALTDDDTIATALMPHLGNRTPDVTPDGSAFFVMRRDKEKGPILSMFRPELTTVAKDTREMELKVQNAPTESLTDIAVREWDADINDCKIVRVTSRGILLLELSDNDVEKTYVCGVKYSMNPAAELTLLYKIEILNWTWKRELSLSSKHFLVKTLVIDEDNEEEDSNVSGIFLTVRDIDTGHTLFERKCEEEGIRWDVTNHCQLSDTDIMITCKKGGTVNYYSSLFFLIKYA